MIRDLTSEMKQLFDLLNAQYDLEEKLAYVNAQIQQLEDLYLSYEDRQYVYEKFNEQFLP